MSFLHRMGLLYPPAGGEPVSYLDYQIRVTAVGGSNVCGLDEIQYLSVAGANLAQGIANGGVTSAHQTQGWSLHSYPMAFRSAPNAGDTDGWVGSGNSGWWQWKDDEAIEVIGATIRAHDASRQPKSFAIRYSDNGTTWFTAIAPPDQTGWTSNEARRFQWASVGAHRYWRLQIYSNNASVGYVGFRSMGFELADGTIRSSGVNKVAQHAWSRFDFVSRPRNMVTGAFPTPIPDTASGWLSTTATTSGNITAYFPIAVPVASLKFWVPYQSTWHNDRMPKDFEVWARTGTLEDWVLLKTVTGQTWSNDPIEFDIS